MNALPLPRLADGTPVAPGDRVRFDGRDVLVQSVEWIQHPTTGHVKVVRFWDMEKKRPLRRNWTELFDAPLERTKDDA